MMIVMRAINMPKTEKDLKAIMYLAYGTHHKMRNIGKNKTQLGG